MPNGGRVGFAGVAVLQRGTASGASRSLIPRTSDLEAESPFGVMVRGPRPNTVETVERNCGPCEERGKGKALRKIEGVSCGETRSSGLWGRRGGRGSSEGRNALVKRGFLVFLALALAAPLAASAGSKGGYPHADTYLAPTLSQAALKTPNAQVQVIVQSDTGAKQAQDLLEEYGHADARRLPIVDAAAGDIRAGDLPELATSPGLAIIPDVPLVLDNYGGDKKNNDRNKGRGNRPEQPSAAFSSTELWPSAVGVDQLWPQLANLGYAGNHDSWSSSRRTPAIAFIDSGIQASRSDFAGRIRAQVDLSSLPGNSPGDGRGHGTFIAGLAAGSAPKHAGAAPTAGIVSIDVMDDQGMARTSDVIAAAQWILHNRRQYDIGVANFSLHSATPTSFRWDPLDKAIEKLWFAGVVVVTSSGNYGVGGQSTRVAYGPANDPFVVTVGALDLHNSANPDRATAAPWSVYGYTYDGFAKPELSAPGRSLVGPVPADSTLALQRPNQVIQSPEGTYMRLSGTSLAAPIVAGIAADILTLHPDFTPDQVKGALMLTALPVRHATLRSAGVGEVYAADAVKVETPPNPNLALNAYLVDDPGGDPTPVFDDPAWVAAVKASPTWNAVSWLDGWAGAAWSVVSWSDVSWSDVSWSDVSWSDVSWADVSWDDVSWADSLDVYSDVG